MTAQELDHVGIAVRSLDESIPLFESITGAPAHGREAVASQGVEIVFLGTGPGRIELLAPTRDDSPLSKFLEKRGPGMHHLCFRVPDIAASLRDYEARGYELIDKVPRTGGAGHLVGFLHPRGTGGVLVELLQEGGH